MPGDVPFSLTPPGSLSIPGSNCNKLSLFEIHCAKNAAPLDDNCSYMDNDIEITYFWGVCAFSFAKLLNSV